MALSGFRIESHDMGTWCVSGIVMVYHGLIGGFYRGIIYIYINIYTAIKPHFLIWGYDEIIMAVRL